MTEDEFEKIIQKCKSKENFGIPIKITLMSELIKVNPVEYYKLFTQNSSEFSNFINSKLFISDDQIIEKFKKIFVNNSLHGS